ncbi:MAG: hypothetical protein ACE5GQ_08865 [Nitrospinales bacterium]
MTKISMEEGKVKEIFKQALLEVLQERKDIFYDIFSEIMEDLALAKAIKEDETAESVSKEEIFQTLEGPT